MNTEEADQRFTEGRRRTQSAIDDADLPALLELEDEKTHMTGKKNTNRPSERRAIHLFCEGGALLGSVTLAQKRVI